MAGRHHCRGSVQDTPLSVWDKPAAPPPGGVVTACGLVPLVQQAPAGRCAGRAAVWCGHDGFLAWLCPGSGTGCRRPVTAALRGDRTAQVAAVSTRDLNHAVQSQVDAGGASWHLHEAFPWQPQAILRETGDPPGAAQALKCRSPGGTSDKTFRQDLCDACSMVS